MKKVEYVLRVTMVVDRDILPAKMQKRIYEYTNFVSRNTSVASILKEEAVSLRYIDNEQQKQSSDLPTLMYLETYYLVVAEIEQALRSTLATDPQGKYIKEEYEAGGMGKMWELAKKYTDEFEELHKDTDWGLSETDWPDTVWEFMGQKLKGNV